MFRRSGSVACYFVEGSTPDPRTESFTSALADHRFRTIEDAADEQTSVGWITAGDPTGQSFDLEDLEQDGVTWLRMRMDKKSAPTKWLQIHREAAEKNAGRRLSGKERKELKEDLLSKLMPRVLPTINIVDALYLPDEKLILLFATSQAVREAFLSLFYRTFSASLAPADPNRLAIGLDLPQQSLQSLSSVAPVNWPTTRNGRSRNGVAAQAATESREREEEVTA